MAERHSHVPKADAFVGANLRAGADLEDLYATLYKIVIFGNDGSIDVTFRCEAMILFIRLLSLGKFVNQIYYRCQAIIYF